MNKKVMVIYSNREYDSENVPFPPIGTIGYIVSDLDEYHEYDVIFDKYPCPVQDISWVTHQNMIVFIDHFYEKEIFFDEIVIV